MNHRERVLATLHHREPDRVPRTATLTPPVIEEFCRRTGQSDPATYWDWDLASVGFRPPDPLPDLRARFGRYYEQLQIPWVLDWTYGDYPPEWGVATRIAHHYHLSAPLPPLAGMSSPQELTEYPFPDYMNEWRHDHLEAEVLRIKETGYPVNGSAGWIFQTAWTLRSREKLFVDFYDNPELAEALLDRVTGIRLAQAVRLAEAGVDMVSLSDDIGIQQSMIMSPAMWRRWIKPRMAALIAAVRRVRPGIPFRYHSDGWFEPVLPDLIEIGVTSLITVQPECMDIYAIKRRYGDALCLEGTIGCQSELMVGTADEVRRMVRTQCEGLKPGGGFIASPANGVEPDVPWENLVALFEALDTYGQYERESE
ncbi:MAG: uroporphyrinogen decarboxylase family protein [Anaerolineae bacterium]